jgi:hypothetical protein
MCRDTLMCREKFNHPQRDSLAEYKHYHGYEKLCELQGAFKILGQISSVSSSHQNKENIDFRLPPRC